MVDRSIRRHKTEVKKEKILKYEVSKSYKDKDLALKHLCNNPKKCSCPLCGNPRKHFGQVTLAEQKQIDQDKSL